jgi:hypothetical protein
MLRSLYWYTIKNKEVSTDLNSNEKWIFMVVSEKKVCFYFWEWLISILSLLSFCFILVIPIKSFAAAWLQPKGQGLVIGTIQPYLSCKYWDKQSNLHSGPCFRQFAMNPYTEYGLLPNLTLIFNPTFLSYSQSGETNSFGLGYINVGGRFLLKQKDYDTFSFQVLYNQPFKSKNFGNTSIPSAQYALANEQPYLDLRLLYGTGGKFDPGEYNTWYADAEASFRPYFDGAADEFHIDFMLGWKTLNQRLIFELQELNTLSLHNPSNFQQPNYTLFTVMPSVIYWYKPCAAFQFGVKQDFYGNNVGRGTAPFIALWFKF